MLDMNFDGESRTVAFIAQDRSVRNGVWRPQHHLAAAELVGECSKRNIAIVSLMDTPGADAEEAANKANQAHSISRLIAEMCNVDVPNIGIVFGLGYSGGAIPLAASNLILSVRDGVFSTIQPKGLANIARRLNLSWQECAKYVGLSPYELYAQGNIDGVIDFAPGDPDDKLENLRLAIVTGIESIEDSTKQFVAENPYILDHYRHNLERYLKPSKRLVAMESRALLRLSKTPTEYTNVFGVAYRYLRYLGTRKRIKATTTKQYGRLSAQELPKGELSERADRERRQTFLKWLQDPGKGHLRRRAGEGLAQLQRKETGDGRRTGPHRAAAVRRAAQELRRRPRQPADVRQHVSVQPLEKRGAGQPEGADPLPARSRRLASSCCASAKSKNRERLPKRWRPIACSDRCFANASATKARSC